MTNFVDALSKEGMEVWNEEKLGGVGGWEGEGTTLVCKTRLF